MKTKRYVIIDNEEGCNPCILFHGKSYARKADAKKAALAELKALYADADVFEKFADMKSDYSPNGIVVEELAFYDDGDSPYRQFFVEEIEL